uniref:Pco112909a n=1 Tax=Arundo donax TaxID=35708 RepID=A0A0A9F394_ARUDO
MKSSSSGWYLCTSQQGCMAVDSQLAQPSGASVEHALMPRQGTEGRTQICRRRTSQTLSPSCPSQHLHPSHPCLGMGSRTQRTRQKYRLHCKD